MVKYLINFLCAFLVLSPFALAYKVNEEAILQNEYGRELTKAPFFLRFEFAKEFNKDWKDSDYLQRKVFLTNYETNLAKEQAQEKADAQAESAQQKELSLKKRQELLKEKARLKAEIAEEKAEQEADTQNQKAFNKNIVEQQRQLQQMERDSTQINQ